MKLCLNMIVKNESARIERALRSVAPFIDSWVIVDTGSTDDTKDKITGFFRTHGIPGSVWDGTFEDWSQARNLGLAKARKLAFVYEPDYFLLMDADMELVVRDLIRFREKRNGLSFEMYQQSGAVHYTNSRLVNARAQGGYVGVTHEYLDIASAGCIPQEVAYFYDHADGSNRPEKFKRDIRLLKKGLKKEPKNERYFFYLAQSYRDAGMPDKAAMWFKRRVEAGGWEEEQWMAQVNYAHCQKDQGNEAGFIQGLLEAYNMRPSRAESMYDLAKYYREKGKSAAALACVEAVLSTPPSMDKLFVNDYVYKIGRKEEVSISAFYVPGKRLQGYKAASELSLFPGPYGWVRESARQNLFHYLQPLGELCPSFKWKEIGFKPPDGYVAMNPSVTMHRTAAYVNVRCVNYRIDDQGRYLILGGDGSINNENPINTRNFLLYLGSDPLTDKNPWPVYEVLPYDPEFGPLRCEYPLVTGFEDVRLFSWDGELWTSATVRQIDPDGNCEQVLSRIEPVKSTADPYPAAHHTRVKRMLRQPRATEKNWAPIVDRDGLHFMWRPGEVVDTDGSTVIRHETPQAMDHISGSSQVIPWWGEYLAVVHEARQLPGSPLRYYYHRFVQYDKDFRVKRVSLPFVFNDKVIEFCAGMCLHPTDCSVVLSYGYKDESARIATVDWDEVEKLLCQTA